MTKKELRIRIMNIFRTLHMEGVGEILYKGYVCWRDNGFKYTLKKAAFKVCGLNRKTVLGRTAYFSGKEIESQRQDTFPRKVLFSVVVPLYNTPPVFLREMIASVQNQTYGNWELCLADGSDDEHGEVENICRELAAQDKRIRYRRLEKNRGISGNTNAGLDMAGGDYIAMLDHDDVLHPAALHEVMRAICEKNADFIYTDENIFRKKPSDAFCPHYKPDFAPDSLRANNYICHLSVFKAELLNTVGRYDSRFDGSQDYDMTLRLTEKAKHIVHIPIILYYWRAHSGSVAGDLDSKPYVFEAAKGAIREHLNRVGLEGEVMDSAARSVYRIKYKIKGNPLISILISTSEHKDDLEKCLESIYEKTTYNNFEVIVIENNSKSKEIFDYYQEIQKKWQNLRVVTWQGTGFNYPAVNNFGAALAKGDYLLLLNNDTEVITPDWLQEMLMFAQREDVGAVGAKLYYPDDTVQHGGVGLGINGIGEHLHRASLRKDYGYMARLAYAQNLSAVTAACMMLPRNVWEKLKGLDEGYAVAFNDVDLCMRIRQAGYLIVWTPFAELYHYESRSRGYDETPEKKARFNGEVNRFITRWKKELDMGDPYTGPNFSLKRSDFTPVPAAEARQRIEQKERILKTVKR